MLMKKNQNLKIPIKNYFNQNIYVNYVYIFNKTKKEGKADIPKNSKNS